MGENNWEDFLRREREEWEDYEDGDLMRKGREEEEGRKEGRQSLMETGCNIYRPEAEGGPT